jgi:hypothetical protein
VFHRASSGSYTSLALYSPANTWVPLYAARLLTRPVWNSQLTHKTYTVLNTNQIRALRAPDMRLEWPIYAFTSGVFLTFALCVQFLSLGTGAVVGLFVLLTVAYAWVAWVMVKRKAVLELHAYISCDSCGELTPSQGKYCMNCGADFQSN